MLKNWSRIALASVLVLTLGAAAANATTSRVRSLANVGDYISDDSAVNRWYSTLVSFANQVNAEMGDWTNTDLTDSRGLGWTHACGEDGKWGTYRISLNEASLAHLGFWAGNPFYQFHAPGEAPTPFPNDLDFPYEEAPINRWDIAGAWEVGESIALGASITESKWAYTDETGAPHIESDNSWLTIGLGATWTNNENMVLDVLFNFGNAGGQESIGSGATATTLEWDSKTAFEFGARMFYDWKDNVTLVPVFDFISSEYEQTFTATPPAPIAPPHGRKSTDMLLGIGLNMDVNQDNMLVFALEYFNREVEYATKDSVSTSIVTGTLNSFPTMRLALESHITSWLTTRVGAAKMIGSFKVEENRGDEEKGTPGNQYVTMPGFADGFDWFLGCGFNFAEWTVDLELAEETPFGLGYWLTGYADAWSDGSGHGPVGRISAVYNY
jgi:hypothetical protein